MNHPTEYKNFTIQLDLYGHTYRYMFYPTEQGIQHDGDMDQDGFRYTGNCKWADSIEEAMDIIDDKIAEQMPPYNVEMNGRNYPWKWLSDAIGFAGRFNGELSVTFINP